MMGQREKKSKFILQSNSQKPSVIIQDLHDVKSVCLFVCCHCLTYHLGWPSTPYSWNYSTLAGTHCLNHIGLQLANIHLLQLLPYKPRNLHVFSHQ